MSFADCLKKFPLADEDQQAIQASIDGGMNEIDAALAQLKVVDGELGAIAKQVSDTPVSLPEDVRKWAEKEVWRKTPKDYRSKRGDITHPSVLRLREGGSTLIPVSSMTDQELLNDINLTPEEATEKATKKKELGYSPVAAAYRKHYSGLKDDMDDKAQLEKLRRGYTDRVTGKPKDSQATWPYDAGWNIGMSMQSSGEPLSERDLLDQPETVVEPTADTESAKIEVGEGNTDARTGNVQDSNAADGADSVPEDDNGGEPTGSSGGRAVSVSGSDRAGSDRSAAADGAGGSVSDEGGELRERQAGRTGGRAESGNRSDTEGNQRRVAAPASAQEQSNAQNYRITEADELGKGGAKTKARQNIAAVRIVKALAKESRQATPEEQAQIVKFVGWGASDIANGMFPATEGEYKDATWQALGEELKSLLTKKELAAARRSTQYAHYTSEAVVRAIYDVVSGFGFRYGKVIEPGVGVGNFIGMLPDDMANVPYTGIEFDPITADIAKALYPQAHIKQEDFTKSRIPRNFFDLAIGNPPFSQTVVKADREYRDKNFRLHDFFFAKTVDRVRPGGLLVFVTSKGTMDKKDSVGRSYLNERADFLGAIRLPQTAFKENAGTEVVTDVIFLRKRIEGEEPAGLPWMNLKEITTPDGNTSINEYFADNPGMMLGEMRLQGSMYRANEPTLVPHKGMSVARAFASAAKNLPKDIYSPDDLGAASADTDAAAEADLQPVNTKENGLYLDSVGRLRRTINGAGEVVRQRARGVQGGITKKDMEITKRLLPIRDAAMDVLRQQTNGEDYTNAQATLNRLYDGFVGKYGAINRVVSSVQRRRDKEITIRKTVNIPKIVREDPDGARLFGLETYDEQTDTAQKGPIFTKNLATRDKPLEINSAIDALPHILNTVGRVDIPAIADAAKISEPEAIDTLGDMIYYDPTTLQWETADEYLSGSVRKKLREAQAAAAASPELSRNVIALEKAQPADIPPSQIDARVGAGWISEEDYQQFARDELGINVRVSYIERTYNWIVTFQSRQDPELSQKYSTDKISAVELFGHALRQVAPKITYTMKVDGKTKTFTDEEGTALAQEKWADIREKFKTWVWSDVSRADRLARIYNDTFNDIVPRTYDGSHLTFPGMSSLLSMRKHQKQVIWRIVSGGNAYMAHSVGAGKTFASIAASQTEKRLGLVRKPGFVVPNHMLQQFASEFLEAYPAAKILVADEENFHTINRRRFVARAASENWDAIIITHSAFGRLSPPQDIERELIEDYLSELREIAALVAEESDDRMKVKRIEQQVEQAEQRLEAIAARPADEGIQFDELGIDKLYVDEAHAFRKLSFATGMGGLKGIDPNGSTRSWDLYVKSKYLERVNPGRGLVLMSGTPVTNTLGELFTIQRYMDEAALFEKGLGQFDAWAAQFADSVTKLEANAAGGYGWVTRMMRFSNLPELIRMFREYADVIRPEDLQGSVKVPKLDKNQMQVVAAPRTPELAEYQGRLGERIEAIKNRRGPPARGDDILLSVIGDGRHAALDMRLVDGYQDLPDNIPSKLNMAIDNIYSIWEETSALEYQDKDGKTELNRGATQMVFMDLGVNGRNGFHPYHWMRDQLIKKGVPAEQIAFMQDYKKSADKLKLYKDMNIGQKRILIGSTPTMGTGVNAQRRLYALHNMDAPWFPADVEQRHGRIIRQGNRNDTVKLFGYVTEGTYDQTMWQLNENKQRMIDGIMQGDISIREMDDLDGAANQFAVASAMASGDERVMRLAGLTQDVTRLSRLRQAHQDEQLALVRKIDHAEAAIRHNTSEIEKIDRDLSNRVDTSGDNYAMTIDGREYVERKEAGEAIIALIRGKEREPGYEEWTGQVGEISGFPVFGYVSPRSSRKRERMGDSEVYIETESQTAPVPVRDDAKALGVVASLEARLRGLEKLREAQVEYLAQAKERLEGYRSAVGAEFAKEQEFQQKLTELDELQAELSAESEEAADAEGQQEDTDPEFAVVPDGWGEAGGPVFRVSQVKKMADELADNIGLTAPITIVSTEQDLPDSITGFMNESGVTGVRGVFHRGRIYIVSNAVSDRSQVEELILHEGAGHYGLHKLFGDQLMKAMNSLFFKLGGRSGIQALAEKHGIADQMKTYFERAEQMDRKGGQYLLTNEFLAFMQGSRAYEKLPARIKRAIREFIGAVRAWLRKKGFIGLSEYKDSDVAHLLVKAGKAAQRPRRTTKAQKSAKPQFALRPRGFTGRQMQGGRTDRPQITEQDNISLIRGRNGDQSTWNQAEDTKLDNIIYRLQNKQIDMKRVVESIREAGRRVSDTWNPYLQEELFHGRTAKRVHDFVETELTPMLQEAEERGLSLSDIDTYLHARHAEEANALIAERNPDDEAMQDGGSGMYNDEARTILDGLPTDVRENLEAVAGHIDNILIRTRNMYASYGLVSTDTIEDWASMFEHYVPLMREDHDGYMGIGQGYSVRGKEVKHRTGSHTAVVDILANIALQREKVIVRGEKNRVAVSLAGLVKMNPNPDFWKFDDPPQERVLNEDTGLVETREVPGFRNLPNVLVAKVMGRNGQIKERAVIFNPDNPNAMRMAEALKNLDTINLTGFMGAMGKVTRWIASVNTQYNPVFGLMNIARDVQGAMLNLSSTAIADHKKEVWKQTWSALKGIYADTRQHRQGNVATSQWAALWEEFQNEGGQTGYRDLYKTSNDRADEIRKTIDPSKWADSPLGKGTQWLFDWLSDYNLAMENAVRLSAYKTAKAQGMSRQQAASLAKNLTVNFNRKGQWAQQAGSLYAFFNASMQGTARIAETIIDMDNGRADTIRVNAAGKRIIQGGLLLGSIQALMMAVAGYDEDEPPEFIRERNIVIPIFGTDEYVTIPMPLGYHVIPNIGRITTEFALGGFKNPGKHVAKLAAVFAEAFNPIGNAGFSLQTIAPTPIDPLVAIAENKDWTGKPIAREDFSSLAPTPGYTRAKDTASNPAIFAAWVINGLTGGDSAEPGLVSPTPDQIDYLIGQVTGGVGRELSKLEQTLSAPFGDQDLPMYKVPIVGRVIGTTGGPAAEAHKFYATIRRMNILETRKENLKPGRNVVRDFYAEYPEARMIKAAQRTYRQVQDAKKTIRLLRNSPEHKDKVRGMKERMEKRIADFNARMESLQ